VLSAFDHLSQLPFRSPANCCTIVLYFCAGFWGFWAREGFFPAKGCPDGGSVRRFHQLTTGLSCAYLTKFYDKQKFLYPFYVKNGMIIQRVSKDKDIGTKSLHLL
jgi:hypothetical protein